MIYYVSYVNYVNIERARSPVNHMDTNEESGTDDQLEYFEEEGSELLTETEPDENGLAEDVGEDESSDDETPGMHRTFAGCLRTHHATSVFGHIVRVNCDR